MAIVDPFERLDLHVIALIVEQLNPVDIIRLQRVSRNWNFILASEYIARVALLAHFPHSPEAVELIERNAKGKVKDDGECVKDKPVKRRRKNKVDILSERIPATEVLGFRRATFRLHTRALAKPCKVHKYRLHHISEKSFAATSTHLFWAESNRNIWVQTIGEGVGGRRSLRLRSFGDTIAHLYQIAATEAGLVIVLFREVATWSLVLMAIEHRTDKIIWKINPAAVPIGSLGLQLTSRHIYYACTAGVPNTNPATIPNLRNMHVYIHSLETGKLIHTTPLQFPVISDCSVAPGSYIVYPPREPTKIFATYHVQAHNNNGACRFVVRVYSIDGTVLNKFDLHRPAVDITRYRPEMPLRFTIIPGTRSRPQEKIMLVELTSRPYLFPQQPYTWWDGLQGNSPVLSSWVLNPVTNEVEEIRRYFSTYADNEKTPTLEYTRDELIGGEYTRLECLDAVSGISYIYYDENKKKEPLINGDEDQSLNGIQPVRAWYESGGARIDSMCYEERSLKGGDTGIVMKQEPCTEVFPSMPPRHEGLHYNLSFNSVHASTQTPLDWPYLSYPQPTNSSAVDSPIIKSADTTSKPVVREFIQTSRHKLVQPDIMRRRRRQNLGEDEEDWQLLPVKTQPMIFMDFKNGNATLNDGRFVFLLAKCAGWSITCFVLDFQPEW